MGNNKSTIGWSLMHTTTEVDVNNTAVYIHVEGKRKYNVNIQESEAKFICYGT